MTVTIDQTPVVPASWLTPRSARSAPVHRWFVFPHSYAPELVSWLLERLDVAQGSRVLDPFCGAGTTLVETQRQGFRAIGFDLLPLAVLVSQAKTRRPDLADLKRGRVAMVRAARSATPRQPPPPILDRAFDPSTWARLDAALRAARKSASRDALQLTVLSVVRLFSRLIADGGWLRTAAPALRADELPMVLRDALDRVLEDGESIPEDPVRVEVADARSLPLRDASVDVVITSPPYPNRHDYTRVFAVELELGFGLGDAVKELRYRALSSHPEARPAERLPHHSFGDLAERVESIAAQHPDARIPRMLEGYFRDLAIVLAEIHRVLVPGGSAAFVVGNAQYCGVPIPVDEYLVEIGARSGFELEGVDVLRLRGNSAQQMAVHGRQASRESVVVFRRKG